MSHQSRPMTRPPERAQNPLNVNLYGTGPARCDIGRVVSRATHRVRP
jgi:hypothetical protein